MPKQKKYRTVYFATGFSPSGQGKIFRIISPKQKEFYTTRGFKVITKKYRTTKKPRKTR